jgi:hypothetical protein
MLKSALLALALVSAPAAAAHYRAEPASAPATDKFVARDTVWTCGNGACEAAQSNSRPQVVCAAVVRKLGTLRAFNVAGEPLSSEELARCNARAR